MARRTTKRTKRATTRRTAAKSAADRRMNRMPPPLPGQIPLATAAEALGPNYLIPPAGACGDAPSPRLLPLRRTKNLLNTTNEILGDIDHKLSRLEALALRAGSHLEQREMYSKGNPRSLIDHLNLTNDYASFLHSRIRWLTEAIEQLI